MRTANWMWVASLGAVSVCAAQERFELRDYLHHTWRNELVCYQVDPQRVPRPARLVGPGGEAVPVQVTPQPDAQVEVAFVVDGLPADGVAAYELTAGESPGEDMLGFERGALVLDAGPVAVRVPDVGVAHFDDPVPLDQVPAPLLQVRGRSGEWIGQGRMAGSVAVQ